jgi:uncharacterized protein (TIGR03382 family)
MLVPTLRRTPWLTVALVSVLAPGLGGAATLVVDEPLVSGAACLDAAAQALSLEWDLSDASGDTIEILGSDTSGCPDDDDDATTAVLVDGLSVTQTLHPASGESAITVLDLLEAAGASTTCDGTDFRVYVCVRLVDASGVEVSTATVAVKLQLQRPPAPTGVSATPGEHGLHVAWTAGEATTGARASSETYRVFASEGGDTVSSDETTSTSLRLGELENGTTYDVWVVAYSEAGNPSDPSELTAGTPVPVMDFWEAYQAEGGVDAGGCAHAGGVGPLAALGVVAWAAVRRRRRAASRELA